MSGLAAGLVGAAPVAPTQEIVEAEKREHLPPQAPSGASTDTLAEQNGANANEGHVNVKDAEAQFETGHKDSEKEGGDSDDFDLLAYLQGEQQSADGAGMKRKAVGVSWSGLTVVGAGGMKIYIRTFPDAVKEFALYPVFKIMAWAGVFKATPKNLLENFDGALKPGEMCLVLGRPGSGCTTFLKTITNQRGGYLGVEGDVSYGGIPAAEMAKRYRGEVTLLFALKLKSPGKLLPGKSKTAFQKEVLDVVTRMLGIPHTKNTKVGSAYVRGVSGGERKRVSIAEMMASRAVVQSWDNSTRGLDASTAFDYAKSLRVLADIQQSSLFVSLYQAGEGIYEQFDKVLVIDAGRQVYFGPAKEARAYMMSLGYADLPRQTTADYLTGCTDPNERQLAPGRTESDVPSTPEALASAFRSSEIYSRMVEERNQYLAQCQADETARRDFQEAVATSKRKGVSKKSVYTASFPAQIAALVVRQFQLRAQDRIDLIVSWTTSIAVALISGSVYYQMPESASGAFTRGGAIFIALLFNSFQAFNELPTQMMGRAITWKHKQASIASFAESFAFHQPSAVTLAMTIADAPNNMLQIFCFCIGEAPSFTRCFSLIYFMGGFVYTAGAFFSFYLIVVSTYFSLAAFFRLLGTLCGNYDQASRLASVLITSMVLYSGYLIPFKRINLLCDSTYILPHNLNGAFPQYPSELGPNQVCTLAGSRPGNAYVAGRDYIEASFQYDISQQWRNWGIVIVFFVGFNIIQAGLAEYLKHGADAPAINVFAKENKERKALNETLEKNKEAFRRGEIEQDLGDDVAHTKPFTYTVPVPGGERQLLDHVFGYVSQSLFTVKPGQLTALMGSSGAGKTTLLDVLANRKTIGVIGGDRLLAGRVEQMDTHEATATIREAFRFSAYLRQPAHVSKAEKDAYVEQVIQLLELEDKADAMIGFPGFGLDVEARKRVTIGVELAAKPQLLLFLDEPTSGLDGQSAYNVVRFLRKLAAAGQAVLVTIHQPNALLFENFDRLLLLKAGGRTVYFGDIGKDSHVLQEYLASHGAICPPKANPAEYMLEAIGAGSGKAIGNRDWADLWLESPEFAKVKREIEELKQQGLAMPDKTDAHLTTEYATNFLHQLQVVSHRTFLAFYRSPDYGFTRLFNHISIALAVGLTFLNLDHSAASLQYRVFAIFFITVIPAIIISQIEPMFIMSRMTFIRESSSKMYSPVVFALSQLAAEMPYSILCSVVFFLLLYFPMGFNFDNNRAGYAYAFIFLVELFAVTLGQAVAALAPTIYSAAMTNPFLLVMFSLFCGVTIPKPEMPYFWRSWMLHLDPFTYIINGLVSNELHGLEITCKESEFSLFSPPSGQTCVQWAGPYISAVGGYLNNPNDSTNCQYCTYAVGDQFYTPLDISFGDRGKYIGYFFAYLVFNCAVTVVASKFLRYAKR
ncbi:SPOSA6832_00050, partial [Sporobolomyces salmonicolor]